ncbi:MAG: GNAT family protein [Ginsengibacter sp.]
MKLQTTRLNFRQVSKRDLNNIHALHSFAETDRFNTLGIPETILDTEKIIDNWCSKQNAGPPTLYVFCVEIIDTKEFIGLIALNIGKPNYKTAELWYKIHPDHWRKGYATEAMYYTLHFAFNDLQLHRIEAGCAVENIASIKILDKVGMIREGLKRKILPIRGEWKDNYFYAILEEDFFILQAKAQSDEGPK